MNNLIAKCWIISSVAHGYEPIIYLTKPEINSENEVVLEALNPFQAKMSILRLNPKAQISVFGYRSFKQTFEPINLDKKAKVGFGH